MALVAKIFGFLCMFGAVFEVLLAGILISSADGGSTSSDSGSGLDLSPSATGFGLLLLGMPVLVFLLFFTVGAAAYVVGDIAVRQREAERNWR